jgi:hypothetical protein
MIARDIIAAVLDRVTLGELIGSKVELRKRGGMLVGLCPFHHERSPSFHVYPNHYHCFGCGVHGDAIEWAMRADGVDFRTAFERLRAGAGLTGDNLTAAESDELRREREARRAKEEAEAAAKQARALEIWRSSEDIEGTPAELYLREFREIDPARLLTDPPGWPETLRWSTDASTEPDGRARPALVIAVNSGIHHHVVAIHRIFLHGDGRNVVDRKGDKIKLALGPIAGNAAELSAWPSPDGRWALAEGIETALSVEMLFRMPCFAAVSGGNMRNVRPPSWATDARVFADNDANHAGIKNAGAALERLRDFSQLRTVKVLMADEIGADANDVLRAAHA